jgi:hypothetical protein
MLSNFKFLRKDANRISTNFNNKLFKRFSSLGETGNKHPSHHHLYHHPSHQNPKHYKRILPAAKHLMARHNITESQLPDLKIIMKEHILDIIQKIQNNQNNTISSTITSTAASKKPLVVINDIPLNNNVDYALFKTKLPHSYFYNSVKVDSLLNHISEINIKHKKNIKIEDFISRACAKLIEKNDKLSFLFDVQRNKIVRFDKSINLTVYVKNLSKSQSLYKEQQFILINPNKFNLAELVRKDLNEFKEPYTPLIRLDNFNLLEFSITQKLAQTLKKD